MVLRFENSADRYSASDEPGMLGSYVVQANKMPAIQGEHRSTLGACKRKHSFVWH